MYERLATFAGLIGSLAVLLGSTGGCGSAAPPPARAEAERDGVATTPAATRVTTPAPPPPPTPVADPAAAAHVEVPEDETFGELSCDGPGLLHEWVSLADVLPMVVLRFDWRDAEAGDSYRLRWERYTPTGIVRGTTTRIAATPGLSAEIDRGNALHSGPDYFRASGATSHVLVFEADQVAWIATASDATPLVSPGGEPARVIDVWAFADGRVAILASAPATPCALTMLDAGGATSWSRAIDDCDASRPLTRTRLGTLDGEIVLHSPGRLRRVRPEGAIETIETPLEPHSDVLRVCPDAASPVYVNAYRQYQFNGVESAISGPDAVTLSLHEGTWCARSMHIGELMLFGRRGRLLGRNTHRGGAVECDVVDGSASD